MINQDLRIGNYYLWDGKICIVGELRGDYAHKVIYKCKKVLSFNELHFYKQMQPIPITEEWLLRMGIEIFHPKGYIIDGAVYYRLNGIQFYKSRDGYYYLPIGLNIGLGTTSIRFSKVHEIQNIFALTGKELEIKEI